MEDVNEAHMSLNVTTKFDNDREGEVRAEDEFLEWMEVVQNGTN